MNAKGVAIGLALVAWVYVLRMIAQPYERPVRRKSMFKRFRPSYLMIVLAVLFLVGCEILSPTETTVIVGQNQTNSPVASPAPVVDPCAAVEKLELSAKYAGVDGGKAKVGEPITVIGSAGDVVEACARTFTLSVAGPCEKKSPDSLEGTIFSALASGNCTFSGKLGSKTAALNVEVVP